MFSRKPSVRVRITVMFSVIGRVRVRVRVRLYLLS